MTSDKYPGEQRDGPQELRAWTVPLILRVIIPVAFIVTITLFYTRPINDPDTYWHLRTGEWLRSSWQFRGADPFTDTAGREWTLHEWVPELLLSFAHDLAGMRGVVFLVAASVGAVILTVYIVCRQRSAILVSTFVTLLTTLAMAASLTARPHLVSYALAAVTVYAWLRSVEDGRPRWWLAVVSWAWASSHGFWFIGIFFGLAVLVGGAVDRLLDRRQLASLTGVWGLTAIAPALSPAGIGVLLAPLQVNEVTKYVSEWNPVALREPYLAAFLTLSGLIVVILARRTSQAPWRYLAVLACAVGLALSGGRLIAPAAAFLAPAAATVLQQALGFARERWTSIELATLSLGFLSGIITSALIAANLTQPSTWGPTHYLPQLKALPENTIVCNAQEVGGWMLYSTPQLRPVIDGRLEIYDPAFVDQYLTWQVTGASAQEIPDGLGCDHVLMWTSSPVVNRLLGDGWVSLAINDSYALLERRP